MSLASLKSVAATKKLCRFEIRPESDVVWLHGSVTDAPAAKVRGTVVLMTSESMHVKHIRLVLQGRRKTHHQPTEHEAVIGPASYAIDNKDLFICQKSEPFPGGTIPAGNHEWPFEFVLDGNTLESIEGLPLKYILYDLHAKVDRGMFAKDLTASRHLKVLRTLGPEDPALTDAQGVHDVWPDKIKYDVFTNQAGVIYGTALTTEVCLVPLLEKLEIQKITFSLQEKRAIKTKPGPTWSTELSSWIGRWPESEIVTTQEMELPKDCDFVDPETQLKGYKFKATWPLPRALSKCRQSVHNEEDWISVRHRAQYEILLKNPDGHFSLLKAHHAVQLYFAPVMPLSDDNTITNALPTVPTSQSENFDDDQQIPPVYQHSHLDAIFPESGIYTPVIRSGAATPFQNFSRHGSSENLVAAGDPSHPRHSLQMSTLQSRLREIEQANERSLAHNAPRENGEGSVATVANGGVSSAHSYFGGGISPADDRPAETPPCAEHVEYDMKALQKVTSYETAVRQPARTTYSPAPPTYEAALRHPSS